MTDTFIIEQSPVIQYSSMDEIAQDVDHRLAIINVNSLVIDEENIKEIKKLRAELKKEFDGYEDARKQIKKGVMNPYDAFEADYKEKIANKFKYADMTLKSAIDNVEGELKRKKTEEVKQYFEEYAYVKNLTFVTFEQANIVVGLSDSMKSLKDSAKQFVDNVLDDLALISTQPHKERIMIRYQSTMDVKRSIASVLEEVKREEAIQQKAEQPEIVIEQPVVYIEPIVKAPEEVLSVIFTVHGTRSQLVALKQYMNQGGLKYE